MKEELDPREALIPRFRRSGTGEELGETGWDWEPYSASFFIPHPLRSPQLQGVLGSARRGGEQRPQTPRDPPPPPKATPKSQNPEVPLQEWYGSGSRCGTPTPTPHGCSVNPGIGTPLPTF